MGSETVKLRLSVWREFTPESTLTQWRAASSELANLTATSDLQREVYSWQMKDDPFGGISDEGSRLKLHDLLLRQYSSSRAPEERRVATLNPFLDEADRIIAKGASEWTISQDAPEDDEDAPYMINPLLALKMHLEWISASFAGQPGVSISIR